MWRNPAYSPPAEKPTPPEDRGERLLTLSRDRDGTELRLCRDEYEGRPYLSLRLWRRGEDEAWWPTKKGVSIRMSEAHRLAEALASAAPPAQHPAPRPAAAPASADAPFDPAHQPPPPTTPSANMPPAWLLEAAAGFTGEPVALDGTPRQVAWAESIRSTRLASLRRRAPELLPVFSTIHDATWWIANKDSSAAEIRWPQPEQTTRPP